MENGDGMSIDDQLATLSLHLTLVAAVGGVILEHVDLKIWKNARSPRHSVKRRQKPGSQRRIPNKGSSIVTNHVLQVNEGVIDGHDLHLLGGESSTGHQTADAAESGEKKVP